MNIPHLSKADDGLAPTHTVAGDLCGIPLPAGIAGFLNAGAEFLTSAFHAYGSLQPGNRVRRIVSWERCRGGNSGDKLALTAEFDDHTQGLHRHLFVKFSRDFDDPFRDRRRYELEPEVRFAQLTRARDFPIRVAKPYFADFSAATGTGLLITEQVRFGEGAVEPLHPKCKDELLEDPQSYYSAILESVARLAGAQKAGRLSPLVDRLFPLDLRAGRTFPEVPWSREELQQRLATFRRFAEECPQLLPQGTSDAAFLQRFETEAQEVAANAQAIRDALHQDERFIALCHWNAHIDNAWFWRNPSGSLGCGLLDWGLVRQMNVAYSLWGSLCGGSPQLWRDDIDDLVAYFADVYHREGGPQLPVSRLIEHLDAYIALIGLAQMMTVPDIVHSRVPDARSARGVGDERFQHDEVARTFLYIFGTFLDRWNRADLGGKARVYRKPAG